MNAGHPDLDKLAREGSAKVGQMLLHKGLNAEGGQSPSVCMRALLNQRSYQSALHAFDMSLSGQGRQKINAQCVANQFALFKEAVG
ncbi:MAG: hypothetical protein FRX49_02973 [Trebouxia sp. A1-2]|nr:MAG: hypothetical protein FRX49_02973 [Trebouxia sp. A1-2]